MATVIATTSQHENGASRPFTFLPKRRRSNTYSHTSFHEDANEMINDNNYPATYTNYTASASTASTSTAPQKHIFPTTPTTTSTTTPTSRVTNQHPMHIDIPPNALIAANPIATPTFIRKKSGELVKPSLKSTSSFACPPSASPSPPSSTSARPRTTSAPATPSASKSVHFDTQLERVKLFLAGQKPLAVSREGSPIDIDTTSASEAEPDSFGISSYPFPSFKPKPRFGPPTSSITSNVATGSKSRLQSRMKLKLIQIYAPSPIPNPNVEPWTFDVRVESVRLSNPDSPVTTGSSDNTRDPFPSLHGTILVHNKAFTKTVFFRYTLDDWNTVSEVSCKHVHTLPGGLYDRFEYRVKLMGLATNHLEGERASKAGTTSGFGSASSHTRPPYRMEFCVRYNVPGWGEWWDSNGGTNYVVEFEWESETVPLSSMKIVSPQPQRFTPNTGASPLLQRLARHSLPFTSGTAAPGHISPPPHAGPGSASMLDERPPMPSPSFPPSFPTHGNSDYFSFRSNKPQAMNIPLRSRYDFGVSLREGAKIMGPAVTSPPPSSMSAAVAGPPSSRSPPVNFSGLPSTGGNGISFPTATRIMSPTPVQGQFRHALATPGKKSSPPRPAAPESAKEAASSPSSTLPLDTTKVETTLSPVSSVEREDSESISTIHPPSPTVPPSPSGRRHVRSWLRSSMSDQDVSSSGHTNGERRGEIGVRKTMSSPAGFVVDDTVSHASPQPQPHFQEESGSSHHHQHMHDGDEDEESEEDGIWFGRRGGSSSGGSSGVASDTAQSYYDIVSSAMRSASQSDRSRGSPPVRFQNLKVVLEDEEAERDEEEADEDIKEMEIGDSSSSSHSSSSIDSPVLSLSEMKESERITVPSSPSSSSTMWSLSSSVGPSDVSLSHSVSTPQFESGTLPLLNAKLARAVLSGTPRSASPSLDGAGNVEIISSPPKAGRTLSPPVVSSPPSSAGSLTPKAETSSPVGPELTSSLRSPTAIAGTGSDLKGIFLNSSSYHSLLDQFCFFTGASSRPPTTTHIQAQTNKNGGAVSEQIRERSPSRDVSNSLTTITENAVANNNDQDRNSRRLGQGVRRESNGAVLGQQTRSSSADPSPYPTLSSSSSYNFNPGLAFNFGFGFDGYSSTSSSSSSSSSSMMMMMNDTHPTVRYGMLKSLGRSFSDPTETFPVRSPARMPAVNE